MTRAENASSCSGPNGEGERDAAIRMHRGKSRGLLINAIAHHAVHEFGDALDRGTLAAATRQLTPGDWAELSK